MRTSKVHPTLVLGLACLAVVAASGAGCDAGLNQRKIEAAGDEVMARYRRQQAAVEETPARGSRFETLPATAEPTETSDRAEAAPPPGRAPEGFITPLVGGGPEVPVSLEESVRRALLGNLQIQIARFQPAIAQTRLREAEALFDPAYFMNNSAGRLKEDTGSFLAGAPTLVNERWSFASGVMSLVPTGATVRLAQEWEFLRTTSTFIAPNPQYDSDLVLELSQPLLRGAGIEVNRSPIVLARLSRDVSVEGLYGRVMDVLLAVEETYWRLAVAETRVAALEEALAAADENLRVVEQRHEAGKARRVVVSLARAAVRDREAALIEARLERGNTSDELKRLMNAPDLPLDEPTVLVTADRPLGEPGDVDALVLERAMLAAMENRPEIRQAELAEAQADVRERVAANERLPRLDLTGRYAVLGLERKLGNSIDEGLTTEFFDWLVGLELEVPIGNRARRAAHKRSRLESALAAKRREDVRQQILLDVSRAARNLAAAAEAVRATRAALEAQQQSLEDQRANVTAGSALVSDLLEAQRDVADAKVRAMDARRRYMTGMAALERAKGTLLEYNHIRVLEE